MELALLKMVHGPGFGEPDAEGGSLFAAVAAEGRRCHVVDRETALRRLAAVGASSTAAAINDAEAETMLISEVRKPTGGGMLFKTDADAEPAEPAEPAASRGADLVFGHLRGYYEHLEGSNKRWAIHTGARLVAATGGCRLGCRNDESARLGGGGRVGRRRGERRGGRRVDGRGRRRGKRVGGDAAGGYARGRHGSGGLAAVADAPGTEMETSAGHRTVGGVDGRG